MGKFVKFMVALSRSAKSYRTVASAFTKTVEKHPDKVAFQRDDHKMTFQMVRNSN